MKKVVITGVTGFFGQALAHELLKHNVVVYGIGRNKEKLCKISSDFNFIPLRITFEEYKKLPEVIKDNDIDVFFHFAWEGGFTSAIKDFHLQMNNAAYAGDAILVAKKLNCKKFVYAGTYNQYEILNILQNNLENPRQTSIYSSAKTTGGIICKTLAAELGIQYSAGLVCMPYGKNNYSLQLTNIVIDKLLKSIPPKLVEGNNKYDLVHINDVVDAFVAIAEKGFNQKEYYVGHRKLTTFRELFIKIRDIIAPEVPLLFGEYKDNQCINYEKINLDELYNDTGFECKVDFKTSIQETAVWIKNDRELQSKLMEINK